MKNKKWHWSSKSSWEILCECGTSVTSMRICCNNDTCFIQLKTQSYSSGYSNINLSLHQLSTSHVKWKRHRNIIWLNPSYSHTIITNLAKKFLQLIHLQFPPLNKFHKIFNSNNVKVSYYCTQNVGNIIKSNNKKLIKSSNHHEQPCNCGEKDDCPLEGKCRTKNIIYKCIVSTSGHTDKVYLETAEGDSKKRYYNHISSFKNKTQMNKTTFAKYIWEQKQRHNITPTLKWYIVKSVLSYSNITKSCMLCLHEKFEILNYPNQDYLLNKRSELVSKCRHINK